jgi:hypothetical protein
MSQSRLSAAKRAAGSPPLRLATAQIDQRHAATRAKSSWFDVAAVTRNVETLLERMYRYGAGLPPDDLMVERHAPAPRAASSAELCS